MKKILLIILSVFSFSIIHAEITWTLSDDGTLSISGADMPDYITPAAPWSSQKAKIKKIVIEDGVTGIGKYAFSGCSNLTSITIPNSVTSIGEYAFGKCSSLNSITIPNSVTSIGRNTFQDCSNLTSITIGNSVTDILTETFYGCSNLASITIPNSVTVIQNRVFFGCSSLASVIVEKGNKKYDSRNECNAIIETESNTLLIGLKNTVIPNSVTSIGGSAFSNCSGLTSITIPESVTSIGSSAFAGCRDLTSITIPESVTSIGYEAFQSCSGLTSITIPESVTSIGNYAFQYCSGLTSITIPESVKSIGYGAFNGAKLRNIVIKAKTPPTSGENAFSDQSYYHTTLMVPEGSWDTYAYSNRWYKFINIREMAYNAVNMTNSKAYMLKSANEGSYLFYDSVNDCVAP